MAERLVIEANYAKHNNQSVTLKSIGADAFQYKSLKMMCQLHATNIIQNEHWCKLFKNQITQIALSKKNNGSKNIYVRLDASG